MLVDDSSTDTPSGLLGVRSRMHFTGRLDVKTDSQQWSLYLYMGRLTWAAGGPHPRRRWHRYLTQHCPQVNPSSISIRTTDNSQCQDFQMLSLLARQQQITAEQAVAVTRRTVQRCCLTLFSKKKPDLSRFSLI